MIAAHGQSNRPHRDNNKMSKIRHFRTREILKAVLSFSLLLMATGASANETASSQDHDIIRIWPVTAPGTEDWTGPEFVGKNSVTNVTVPTLTVFRPLTAEANGTAVVVAPGGGFQGLALKQESDPMAHWLTARGITVFALKYRVRYTPGLQLPAGDTFDQTIHTLEPARKIAVADGLQAMRYLKANAKAYEIDSGRIGMMGFSAGAMTTMGVIMEAEPDEGPDFAASVYGSMMGDSAPEAGPPLFIVHAQDDRAVPVRKSIEMYSNWTAAGLPVELHIYEKGGHGFGAIMRNSATDGWLSAFEAWLLEHGWIQDKHGSADGA